MNDYALEKVFVKSIVEKFSPSAVHLRTIDRHMMQKHPHVIEQGHLLALINELIVDGSITWDKPGSSVKSVGKGTKSGQASMAIS